MSHCRICRSGIEPFIDFGRMPLANGFLTADRFDDEYFFHLQAASCPRCTHVQLVEQPPRERMFHDRYPFFSSSSARMAAHFAGLARDVMATLSGRDAFVVEIGSNDGTLLDVVSKAGVRHLGVEPSASVDAAAAARGVRTVRRFFDAELARTIVAQDGPADAVIAANALSHVADLHAVVEGISILLSANGTAIIEDPYWGDVVSQTAFDQIYDEHASYFTLASIQRLFSDHDLAVVDAMPVDVHGGSMRYVIARPGSKPATSRVEALHQRETTSGLHERGSREGFRARVQAAGEALLTLLKEHRTAGRRVVGYGATSKSTTTINFFGITPELVEFISDTTPAKHGTFSPGAHIPVRPHEAFTARYPERALLFSWNHAAEVRAKEQAFADSGGRWIVYVPAVQEW